MELGSMKDEVVNRTRAVEALSPSLNHPRKTIDLVEFLVVAAALLLLLQLILGCCKRWWHNSVVKYVLLVPLTFMNPLIIYTLGMMQSSPIKNSSYPVWAGFLIMASAGTTAVRQFDFYDSYWSQAIHVVGEYLQIIFYAIMFTLLMDPNTYTWKTAFDLKRSLKNARASSLCVSALVYLGSLIKAYESTFLVIFSYKVKASLFITLKKGLLTKVAERTEEEGANDHRARDSDPQQSMKGYKYAIFYPLLGDRLITIDQIWDCCGNSADGKALKDLCLSCALFVRLRNQRYFGQAFGETSHLNGHDFVFKKLLPSVGDFKRAFRIIEVELDFFYDFFFTKYHYNFIWMNSPLPFIQPYLFLFKITLILIVGVLAIRKSLVLETPNPIIEVRISDTDYIITLLVLGVALMVELVQAAVYLASDWVQVSLACMHVKKYWFLHYYAFILEKIAGCLRSFKISGQLRNKIKQHSVIFGRFKQPDPVEVSDAVKRAVARSLISTYGSNQTTNGETSLWQKKMFDKYSWALKYLSEVEVMLIWHIATEYCDISVPIPTTSNQTTRCRCNKHRGFAANLSRYCAHLFGYVLQLLPNHRRNRITRDNDRGVAVHLSRYCAYLIGSVPELLPYHETDIAELAKRVMAERNELFGFYFFRHPKIYGEMKSLEGTEEEDDPRNIFQKGVKLGKQLKRLRDEDCWELLQDFWAETIIHAAASHYTTKQHMQHLENGGEFLTHIWALLCHAGVLNLKKRQATDQDGQANLGSGPSAV